MREVESSVWLVQFSEMFKQSPEGTGGYRRNYDVLVVAPTLEEAVGGVRELHPEATMHSAHRRGTNKTVLVIEPGAGLTTNER